LEILPDVAADPDLAEMLGDEPEGAALGTVASDPVEPVVVPVAEIKIVAPTPAEWKPAETTRPISPVLAGLLRR